MQPRLMPVPRWLHPVSFAIFALAYTAYCLHFVSQLSAEHPAWTDVLLVDRVCIMAIGVLLAALAPLATRTPPVWGTLMAGALVGAMWYFRSFGWAWLNPTAIDWLLHGDLAQHYLGWAMFRQEPWHWPPGTIESLRYPIGSSVFFTDAHPLLALLMKPFHALLPTPFQYIGLTYLLNWTLMGLVAAAVLRLASKTVDDRDGDAGCGQLLQQSLTALLLVLAPVLTSRIGHDTLTGQWQIVAAIGLSLWYGRQPHAPPPAAAWIALTAISALTHLYLLGMVLAILAADRLRALLHHRSLKLAIGLHMGLTVPAIVLCALWLAGAFTVSSRQTLDYDNIGRWSADLLSLVDPSYASRWLPALSPLSEEQWEGWAYLGAGSIILILVAVLFVALRPDGRDILRRHVPLWLIAIAMYLFALGPTISAAGHVVVESEWLKQMPLYALFRSCGRFVWPLHYLLLVAAALILARSGIRIAIPALALACVIQIVDLRMHDSFGESRVRSSQEHGDPLLLDPNWDEIVADRRHVELVPARGCGPMVVDWLPVTELAARHGLSVNSGYVARIDQRRWHRYCRTQAEQLATGERRSDTVYLVHSDLLDEFRRNAKQPVRCTLADGLAVCLADAAPSRP